MAKRGDVSAPTLERICVAQIAEMLDYAVASRRRQSLHRYLIAAVTTLARPEAICDMNVEPARQQWDVDGRRFNLNPAGRKQTAKYRPIVPVGDLLDLWLRHADDWLVHYYGRPVLSVHNAWNTMLGKLGMPARWEPKLLRHSMATHLPARGVDPWELEGQLGHKKLDVTETYAVFAPDYLGTVQQGTAEIVADLFTSVPQALHPKCTQNDAGIHLINHKKKDRQVIGSPSLSDWSGREDSNLRPLRPEHSFEGLSPQISYSFTISFDGTDEE